MSEEHGDDLNFNELVGNLLSSHNADENLSSDVDKVDLKQDSHGTANGGGGNTGEVELPDFGAEEEDLAAVVASAIQNMNEQPSQEKESQLVLPEQHPQQKQEQEQEEDGEANTDAIPIEVQVGDEEAEDNEQNQEWAHLLQQGLIQGHESSQAQPEEQLDQDDETLRRAILESLQELNVRDKGESDNTQEPLPKEKDKKSKPKKSPKKPSSTSSSKKRKDTKKRKSQKEDDDLLNFEDVIRGFMHPEDTSNQDNDLSAVTNVGDAETQALVEATLKAFERELLGPAANAPKPTKKKSSSSSSKKKSSNKKSDQRPKARTYRPLDLDRSADDSKSKKDKQHEGLAFKHHGDDFSKQLAEMVNQVVNTTAPEELTTTAQRPEEPAKSPAKDVSPSVSVDEDFGTHGLQSTPAGLEDGASEAFDLNQIMQRAMNMAFQEQEQGKEQQEKDQEDNQRQQDHDGFDDSIMEEFNRGLADLSVGDLDTGTITDLKEDSLKDGDLRSTDELSEYKKPSKPSKEVFKKRYSQVALAAAHVAKKRLSEKNKFSKLREKEERQKVREDKKFKKKEVQEKLEEERRELEEIVARGPPYPPDLRLTKSGKPKKPYRRWTPEELAKRAAFLSEQANSTSKEQKVMKRKSKKLKRVPLYNLKNIPIFNFIKSNVANKGRNKQGLNGIEETLNKIPLANNNLDLNRLAPPDSMSTEQASKDEDGSDLERSPVPFVLQRKTVVHREKIPFHPPWAIPAHPPLALPVARRRRKEKINEWVNHGDNRGSLTQGRPSGNLNVRNKIVPAVLLPIINTLKSAARAKAASGASSEDSNRHLMNIIKHTKNTIAQTLESTRRNSLRNYSTIKTEKDIEDEGRNVRRMPIFSLANIKKIDTSDDEPKDVNLDHDQNTYGRDPPLIKLENPEASRLSESQENIKINPKSSLNIDELASSEHRLGDEKVEKQQHSCVETSRIDEQVKEQHSESQSHVPDTNEPAQGNTKELPVVIADDEGAEENSSKEKADRLYQQKFQEKFQDQSQTQNQSEDGPATKTNAKSEEGFDDKGKFQNHFQVHDSNNNTMKPRENTLEGPLQPEKEVLSVPIKQEERNDLGDTQTQSRTQDDSPHNAFEDLVKQQLIRSYGSNVDLPNNLGDIISATLANVFPDINDNKKPEIKGSSFRPERKRYKKGPPPVLNLDGSIPPSGVQVVPKAEPKLPLENADAIQAPKPKKPKKKSEQPIPLHTFNVPNFKDIQGRRTMLLKRAKYHLNDEEMSVLKKEINKERKRKWREVNVEKNWEHDMRARLKKRANIKFGELNSAEKNQWFENEVSKSLAERGIKQEDNASNGNGNANSRKNTGSTNLSDNEVLNMIATALGKLDVARILERELNELAKTNETKPSSTTVSKQLNTPSPIERIPDGGRDEISSGATEFKTVQRVRREEEMDEEDEEGPIKRPYPDDIPVMVPILKRPKFLNTEGNP